jgi:hypothetical protein
LSQRASLRTASPVSKPDAALLRPATGDLRFGSDERIHADDGLDGLCVGEELEERGKVGHRSKDDWESSVVGAEKD